ncbi:MAG TPA: amidohydrolase family protein [Gemmatimonadaceae bacterium]
MLPILFAALVAANDSTVYPVLNHGRVAGSMVVVTRGDSVTVRYVFTDRNRGARVELRYLIRGDSLRWAENRPVLANEQAGEPTMRMEVVGDSLRRTTQGRTTTEKLAAGTFLGVPFTPWDQARLASYLLRQPTRSATMIGGLTAKAEVVKEATVPTSRGNERVRLVSITTSNPETPQLIWLDSRGGLFVTEIGWFMTVRPGGERALPALRKIETDFRDTRAEVLAKRVVKPTNATIAITNGDLFDSEQGVVRPNTTVIIRGDRIVDVGPTETTTVPAGATVIDASGKTIVPGLWDMHGHMQMTSQSLGSVAQLSFGLTTVRDLASDLDVAVSQRDRAASGRLAGPRQILAGFIEGPLKWAGPSEVLVSTEEEARRWVARYDSMGYKQVKLYNVVHPDLVPTIVAEAHKRGMRVSGHIPRGLTVPAAVELGFDEINHAAFLFSTFYQDSLYVPTMRAYSLVASTVAPNIDVEGKPMSDLIAFLKQHDTVIDGTFSVWITSAGTGIAQSVGAGVPSNVNKADENYLRLIKRLYDAKVTMVPGTDNSAGTTYNAELEVYERAGLPAPFVLQMATIISARVMKDDKDYGSIAPGKIADVVIVNGKPAEKVSELRKIEQVIRAGRLYDVQQLKVRAGLSR